MAAVTKEVVFTRIYPAGQGSRLSEPCPVTGKITQIIRQWPRGSNGLVDIAVGHHPEIWMLPNKTDTYVALDDATVVISGIEEPVGKGQELWVRFRNADAVNPHTPSVTFIVEGTP